MEETKVVADLWTELHMPERRQLLGGLDRIYGVLYLDRCERGIGSCAIADED